MNVNLHRVSALLALALPLLLQIKGAAADEHFSHESHTHGLVELTVAIDNDELEIELNSPAMNLIGFEYKASTKSDLEVVKRAKAKLSQNNLLFLFSGGSCQLSNQAVDISSVIDTQQLKGHQPKAHVHKSDHQDKGNHNDISAVYHYSCEDISSLTNITVNAFNLFENIEEVQVFWINTSKQGEVLLNRTNNIINLQ